MRLKTFTAPDMPAALKLLRTELGAEALILSTRKIKSPEGNPTLEITAALPEHAPHAPAQPPQRPLAAPGGTPAAPSVPASAPSGPMPFSGSHLAAHALPPALHKRLTAALKGLDDAGFSEAEALEMVLPKTLALTTPNQQLTPGHAHVLVGPHGAGKTTLMGKLAFHYNSNNYKVGLLSLDDHKIAGFEPLQTVAEILGDTAALISTPNDLARAAKTLGSRAILLIDTPGLTGTPAEAALQTTLLQRLNSLGISYTCHLVLPANLHPQSMALTPAAYQRFNPASLIATKLDVTGHLGGLLAAAAENNLPLGLAADSPAMDTPPITLTAAWLAQALTQPPLLPWETRA